MPDFDLVPEFDDELELLEFDLPLEIEGFSLDFELETAAAVTDTVIIKRYPRPRTVRYRYAADLAANTPDLADGEAMYAVVSGNFIFGDYLEALMVQKNYLATEMLIATLSMSQENVDSLKNIMAGGYAESLSVIVSDFWYAHERRRTGGVPYILDTLGGDNFHFAAAGLHTKVALIKTSCGRHLVLHGSANLRSSRNIEQFCIENNEPLFAFNKKWMAKILHHFGATNKSVRGDQLWQTAMEPQKKQS